MAKDLYAVLGLSRDASAEDIKKAYRRLSKEWHPDRHKGDKTAETKFKEINEAYEVLGNVEKRQRYDQFGSMGGSSGFGGANGFGGFDFSGFSQGGSADFSDIFESFFGGAAARGRPQDRTRGDDREVEVTIDFMDSVRGAHHAMSLKKLVACDRCTGSGAEPGSHLKTCPTCSGTGQVTRQAQSFFGMVQQKSVCPECGGAGKMPEKACTKCDGEGRTRGQTEVTIDIPAGIADGQTLKLRGAGDAGRRGGEAGDLFVHVRVHSDPRFERAEHDIRSTVTLPVIDAILGRTLDVETVHGTVTLQIPEGMQPGQVFRLRSKGMPVLGGGRLGDHYVKVDLEIPRKLSKQERKLMEEWRQMHA